MGIVYALTVNGIAINANYWANVMYFGVTHGDELDPYTAAAQIIGWFEDNVLVPYADLVPSQVIIKGLSCYKISDVGGPSAVQMVNVAGSAAGDGHVAGVGANLAGAPISEPFNRQAHIYTPGLSDLDYVEGEFTDAFATRVATFSEGITADIVTDDITTGDYIVYNKTSFAQRVVTIVQLRPKPVMLNKRLRPQV